MFKQLSQIGIAALGLGMSAPAGSAGPQWRTAGLVEITELTEISGLAASVGARAILWAHNDSGHAPALYAIDRTGRLRQRVEVREPAGDWEDIARFDWNEVSFLAIADTGDNLGWRSEGRILLLPEPDADAASAAVQRVITVRFPGGPRDVEALAVDAESGQILLLEKRLPPARLYALDLDGPDRQVARVVGELPAVFAQPPVETLLPWKPRDLPTAMELHAARRELLVMSYRQVLRFRRRDAESWGDALARGPDAAAPLPRDGRLYEALAVDDSGVCWVSSEGASAPLLRLDF